jgi:GT2 family glycosyltransferase
VIIVAWNSRDELAQCLESLRNLHVLPLQIETLVVDNASRDGTAEFLRENLSRFGNIGLRVIYNDENLGLSRATEQAYEAGSGNWILLCNPDIVFDGDFKTMLTYAVSHPGLIVAPQMVGPDGRAQMIVHRRFPTVTRVFFGFGFLGSYLDATVMRYFVRRDYCYERHTSLGPVVRIDQPGASLLLMNRNVVERVGGVLSEVFPVYWNDVDLARRAQRAGIERVLMSNVMIGHHQSYSGSKPFRPWLRYLFCRGLIRYARKWHMHPMTLRILFFWDAVLSIPLFVFLQRRSEKFWTILRLAIGIASSQARAVATA